MAVVLTLVQTEQIGINIHKRNSTKTIITAIEFSLGGSRPYTSTDRTDRNKYT